MKFTRIALVALLGVTLAAPVFAQPGPGAGPGMGPGSGMGPGAGTGPAAGGHVKAGRFAWNKSNTAGWSLMTAEERTANQTKMRAVKTYDECKVLQDENHKTMEARAKEKGVTLPAPRQNGCDRMKARGLIK